MKCSYWKPVKKKALVIAAILIVRIAEQGRKRSHLRLLRQFNTLIRSIKIQFRRSEKMLHLIRRRTSRRNRFIKSGGFMQSLLWC